MKISVLKSLIREILILEFGEATGASGSDPNNAEGFYPYEIERGVDVNGFWYKSPGDKGSGDPGRPDDPSGYIGMKAETESAMDSASTSTTL